MTAPSTPTKQTAQIVMFVRKEHLEAFLDLGWEERDALKGTHHGQHAVLMEWTRDDKPSLPPAYTNGRPAETGERKGTA